VLHRRLLGLTAAVVLALACAAPAPAAGPANVTVRVEGDSATLVPRTALATSSAPIYPDGTHPCSGTSAGGALNDATNGNWAAHYDTSFGEYVIDGIMGESHTFGSGEYWAVYVDDVPAADGACNVELQPGDSVLYTAASESGGAPSPLELSVPATAQKGQAFTVTATEVVTTYDASYNATTTRQPAAGATISGGDATVTTGADGTATVTVGHTGVAGLRASKAGDVRSATEGVCVHDGSDGTCGTSAPGQPAPPPAAPCATNGHDGLCGTVDRTPDLGQIKGILEHERFAHGKGPRTLSGIANPDPSGLRDVALRLTRTDRGRCSAFDGRRERLVRMRRCGASHGKWFSAGNRSPWSYLLPSRLPRGRYVLDVRTTDGAGNVDATLQRTRDRVVFSVR
jgi:uncharacterized protein DUF4430